MLDQLLSFAKDNLTDILDGIPEMQQMDKQQSLDVMSKSVVNTIMDQVKSGDFSALKEMLNGNTTAHDSDEVKKLHEPIAQDLMKKLNLSENTSGVLSAAVIPIIMNMLNNKVSNAKSNGVDVDGYLNKMEQGSGLLSSILKLFGAKNLNPSGKIAEQLIRQIIK